MTFSRGVFFLALMSPFVVSKLESCSRLFWNDNNQAKVVARTMDLFISDEPELWINPRGIEHQSQITDRGLAWNSLYGSVSVSAFRQRNNVTDGLNEHGFAAHVLVLKETKYESRDDRFGITQGEWIQYLLDTCQTVEEALLAHQEFQVVAIKDIHGFVWPLHLMIEDATGDSAIVEFIDGNLQIHRSPMYQVGTNSPIYGKQLENVLQYENFGGDTPISTLQTADSFGRFVLGSTYLKQLPEPKDPEEAFSLMKTAITKLFVKKNRVQNSFLRGNLIVSTLWTSFSDLTHRTYLFMRPEQDLEIRIDLSKIDFSDPSSERMLDLSGFTSIKN